MQLDFTDYIGAHGLNESIHTNCMPCAIRLESVDAVHGKNYARN